MSSSYVFTSLSFRLIDVEQLTSNSLRITYSAAPKQVSASNSDDALNITNYQFTGPTYIPISSIAAVGGDYLSMDVFFDSALTPGTWSVTVINVEDAAGTVIGNPSTLDFTVSSTGNVSPVTAGAQEESPSRVIRKHLNPLLQGPVWTALIEAISTGDDTNWDNVQKAAKQLFVSSSEGKYLNRNAADMGIQRPDIGMSDALFQELVINFNANKLTHQALNKILNIFFGDSATRAWIDTELLEPFELSDNMWLDVVVDQDSTNQNYRVFFTNEDFENITQASALEVANVINKYLRQFEGQAFAVPVNDYETGTSKVRIYSGSIGPKSFIKVTGGSAQPYLQFSTYLDVYTGTVVTGDGYSWVYSNPEQGQTRIELTEATPKLDLHTVQTGDYVVIGEEANSVEGTYEISDIEYYYDSGNLVQAIIIDEDLEFTGSATQDGNYAYQFFRPSIKNTLNNGQATVALTQTTFKQIDVRIPPTTQVVNRDYTNAAYIKGADDVSIKRIFRDGTGLVTIETNSAHGLSTGDKVWVDGARGAPDAPWLSPESTGDSETGASFVSFFSGTANTPAQQSNESRGSLLLDGSVLICGGDTYTATVSNGISDVANRFELVQSFEDTSGTEADGSTGWEYSLVATTNMNTARIKHTCNTLDDGRVLVAGGYDGSDTLRTCELYNPGDDTWTTTAWLGYEAFGHKTVKLNDGRLLTIGGAQGISGGTLSAYCQLFDPATNIWSAVTSIPVPRFGFDAIATYNEDTSEDLVYVTGGYTAVPGSGFAREGFDYDGVLTNSACVYNVQTDTWTELGAMRYAHGWHRMVELPDGQILVLGGMSSDPSAVAPASDPGTALVYPNNNNAKTEIYNPTTGRWYKYTNMPFVSVNPNVVWLPTQERFFISGGVNFDIDYTENTVTGPTVNYQGCLLDPDTGKFSLLPRFSSTDRDLAIHVADDIVVFAGGLNSAGTTLDNLEVWVPASNHISNGHLNDIITVDSVVNSTTFTASTTTDSYTSNFSALDGGQTDVTASSLTPVYQTYNGWWSITNAVRSSNVTTLTTEAGHPFAVDDVVFVNITTANYTAGIYTITAVTATTITYAETGGNVGSGAATGGISLRTNVPEYTEFAQQASAGTEDLGPYIYDIQNGLAVTGTDTALTVAVAKNSQQNILTVTSTADFPDSESYFVLDFGGPNQTPPIKYLQKISTTELLLDYRYEFQADFAVGSTVTLLYSREPWAPESPDDAGSFYITGSTQGRIYAQQFVRDAAAGGFEVNFDIAYPSDYGLGSSGSPTEDAGKLSDIVGVYGADEVT